MRKNLTGIIIILTLVGVAFYGQAHFGLFAKPCSRPITYSLDQFDTQFNMTEQEFLANVDKAAQVWESATGIDLFQYQASGKLKINLVYDYRQQATDGLRELGYNIDNTQASYESLKSRYNQTIADYNNLMQSLDRQIADYNKDKQEYEQEVKKWNNQGGAPKNVVSQLDAQRDSLNSAADKINRDQATLNSLATSINSMVDLLNRMAANLNITVTNYNTIGASRGEEFEEGLYIESGRNKQIDIYEFDNETTLVRVLAHELGHALGLEHLDSNPDAIMYRLNQGGTDKATVQDIQAVKQLCGI